MGEYCDALDTSSSNKVGMGLAIARLVKIKKVYVWGVNLFYG